ncbi:MAG: WecB/TagA/CpsF family glycosyltransferase [Microcoleaceae cyanobacterium MO_207.B10]|nr:WecB/TagA/CpsF family glycosyltransferase [Microcoleaceae cyanobacterium MO_207.B10]
MPPNSIILPPSKTNLLGIGISRTNYKECTDFIIQSAKLHAACNVAAVNVHSITMGYLNQLNHGNVLRSFTISTPDGQPIRWGINLFRERGEKSLKKRVRGPQLMLDVCDRAAFENISIFLYGGRQEILDQLQINLKNKFPTLKIAGAISPPFRPLTAEEDAADVAEIRSSGAGIVFVSLGCPKQELWAFKHSDRLSCPIVCVGAAFNFHGGNIPEAPEWMQRFSLEWSFRFYQEPRRLWKRYLVFNSLFILFLFLQLIKLLPVNKSRQKN